jgi:hypothetical protein
MLHLPFVGALSQEGRFLESKLRQRNALLIVPATNRRSFWVPQSVVRSWQVMIRYSFDV